MDYSSEEDSDISESEIEEYAEKPYEQLRAGKYKVKNLNGTLRCPYCAGKKKQEFKYKDLLQHASGVGKGSANRSAQQKANHLALAKYLETDLACEAEPIQRPALPQAVNQPLHQEDLYVWPWTGIIVNIKGKSIDSGYWLKEFAKFRPIDFRIFLKDDDLIAGAVVDFNNDWNGFMNASDFEKSFEAARHGKKDWNSRKLEAGSNIYGWVAREDDYNCGGPIGEYLRNKGRLRTVTDIVQEASESRNSIVTNLTNEIEITNENLDKMQYKFNEKTMSLSRMLEEKDKLHNAFEEESRNMQRRARNEVRRILDEQEKLSSELEEKKRKLDSWSRDLNKREALTDQEKKKLEEDNKKFTYHLKINKGMDINLIKKVGAEFLGTFLLMLAAISAAIEKEKSQGQKTMMGCAEINGVVMMIIIYSIGNISGAHLNPAVTISFAAIKHIPWKNVPLYIGAQVLASVSAAFALKLIFHPFMSGGVTVPSVGYGQAFVAEFSVSFTLMFVVTAVANGTRAVRLFAGIVVGATVMINIHMAGAATGSSMNPARTLGPAIAAHNYKGIWIYLTAPILGSLCGAGAYTVLKLPDRNTTMQEE